MLDFLSCGQFFFFKFVFLFDVVFLNLEWSVPSFAYLAVKIHCKFFFCFNYLSGSVMLSTLCVILIALVQLKSNFRY